MKRPKKSGEAKAPIKKLMALPEDTNNSPKAPTGTTFGQEFPGAFMGWKAPSEQTTKAPLEDKEITTGADINSYPALIQRYLLSKDFIPLILFVVVIGWTLIQDNAAGHLSNLAGMGWFFLKFLYILGLYFVILLCQFLFRKLFGGKF